MQKVIIFLITFTFSILTAEDYQYQYFNRDKKKYVPFSDYIPRYKLHMYTRPHYLEDYYLLYGMKLYYNENSLRTNINRLKKALNTNFRHPKYALIKINNAKEYLKYRRIMYMQINYLIMRNYLRIAAQYDKRRIYFYDSEVAKRIRESLKIAEQLYFEALPYWKKTKHYAKKASEVKITLDMGNIESKRYSIIHGETDFGRIIAGYLNRLKQKRKKLDNYTGQK